MVKIVEIRLESLSKKATTARAREPKQRRQPHGLHSCTMPGNRGGRGRRRAHERDVDDEVPIIGAGLEIAGEHVEEISGTEAKQVSDECRKDCRNRPCVGLCAGQPNAGWFRPDQATGARPYAGWLLPE